MIAMLSSTAAEKSNPLSEKLENGWKGLKHWKKDLFAGLVVSFAATPVSIGIAIASGVPPIAGLISVVMAGFVLPLIGGSYVTIGGPVAGLAPAIYAAILSLNHGSMEEGLPVIFIVGLVQMALSRMKVAQYSKIFPAAGFWKDKSVCLALMSCMGVCRSITRLLYWMLKKRSWQAAV